MHSTLIPPCVVEPNEQIYVNIECTSDCTVPWYLEIGISIYSASVPLSDYFARSDANTLESAAVKHCVTFHDKSTIIWGINIIIS